MGAPAPVDRKLRRLRFKTLPGPLKRDPGAEAPVRPSWTIALGPEQRGSLYRYTMCKPLTKAATSAGTPASLTCAPPQGGGADAARSGAGATGAPTETPDPSLGNEELPPRAVAALPSGFGAVSTRRVAWVGTSDEATRERLGGSAGGAPLEQSDAPPPVPPRPRSRVTHTHSYTHTAGSLSPTGIHSCGLGRRRVRGAPQRVPPVPGGAAGGGAFDVKGSYLVDPASSHMLVSKIKPCMSKYKLLYTVKLRMAH